MNRNATRVGPAAYGGKVKKKTPPHGTVSGPRGPGGAEMASLLRRRQSWLPVGRLLPTTLSRVPRGAKARAKRRFPDPVSQHCARDYACSARATRLAGGPGPIAERRKWALPQQSACARMSSR